MKDLRAYSRQTRNRLIFGGVILIFLIGTLLVGLTYGTPAAGCALAFFLFALVPVGFIVLVLAGIQWIVDRANRDDSGKESKKDG